MVVLGKKYVGEVLFLNCVLSIIHSWIFYMNFKENSQIIFFLNLILVVLHHFMFCWPRPYIFVIVLLSLSKHINLLSLSKHINLPLNHLIIVLKKKITIASPKTDLCMYIITPSLDFSFAFMTASVHVFRYLLYLRKYISDPLTFCIHHTPK